MGRRSLPMECREKGEPQIHADGRGCSPRRARRTRSRVEGVRREPQIPMPPHSSGTGINSGHSNPTATRRPTANDLAISAVKVSPSFPCKPVSFTQAKFSGLPTSTAKMEIKFIVLETTRERLLKGKLRESGGAGGKGQHRFAGGLFLWVSWIDLPHYALEMRRYLTSRQGYWQCDL